MFRKKEDKMIILLGALFFLYQFIVRIFFGFAVKDIMTVYNVDIGFIGVVAGAYYLGYALSNLCTAVLFSRYDYRIVTTYGALLIVLGLVPFCIECAAIWVLLGRIIIGIGSGMALPFAMKTIFTSCSKEQHSFWINTVLMLATLMLSVSLYVVRPQYNVMFKYVGLMKMLLYMGIVFVVLFVVVIGSSDGDKNDTEQVLFSDIFKFFFNKKILLLGTIGGLFVGALEGFADLWATYFFEDVYGFASTEIAISIFWICLAVGGFVLEYIYSVTGANSVRFLIYIGLVKIAVFVYLFYTAYIGHMISMNSVIAAMVVLGVCSAYQFFLFGQVPKIIGVKYAVLGIALVNALNMLFGQIFHVFIAKVFANATTAAGKALTATSYINGFSIIPVALMLGVILCYFFEDYINNSDQN